MLAGDKKNESNSLMDGAWTGHPDQNEIAVSQFPAPNQLQARPVNANTHPDLRPLPEGVMVYADHEKRLEPLPAPKVQRAEVIDELHAAVVDGKAPLHLQQMKTTTVTSRMSSHVSL